MISPRDWSTVRVVGVARLANYLKRKLEADANLAQLGVRGEITNLRVQTTGGWNFDVKDRDAVLACFAFAGDAATFPEARNGDAVVVYGRISSYERASKYQLVARHLEHEGVGALHARVEELRKKLEAEGLFRAERKRPLPRYPFRVVLVGSRTGDGTRDFLTQARARAPQVTVELAETAVQGDVATQIVAALRAAAARKPDLIVLARGGGSFEDLFVFNDERVVRAIVASPIPVVTAIGHESNTSLADYAADHQAPTPSTAAQTVLPRRDDLLRELRRDRERLTAALRTKIVRARTTLERIEHRTPLADPALLLAGRRQRLDAAAAALRSGLRTGLHARRARLVAVERAFLRRSPDALLAARRARLGELRARLARDFVAARRARRDAHALRLDDAFRRIVERAGRRVAVAAAQLGGADPRALLRRGYAIVARADGHVLLDPADAPSGTRLRVQLARGELAARVESEITDAGEQIGLF
ncbi:MAG TPA: exodeoxyribonuclease VII large subunit [Candidatus Sulfotelmatobacter sp.]|nr:exodeoxyribonuclease VII large subunit [Candidatus Sulfotelmatobacter sp.]